MDAPLGDGRICASPAVVLYIQGCISSCFGFGRPIDDTIQHIQAEPHYASSTPEIGGFELDGRLYSINNRRLHAFKVRACIGVLATSTAGLLPRHDPPLQRQKSDAHRPSKSVSRSRLHDPEIGSHILLPAWLMSCPWFFSARSMVNNHVCRACRRWLAGDHWSANSIICNECTAGAPSQLTSFGFSSVGESPG